MMTMENEPEEWLVETPHSSRSFAYFLLCAVILGGVVMATIGSLLIAVGTFTARPGIEPSHLTSGVVVSSKMLKQGRCRVAIHYVANDRDYTDTKIINAPACEGLVGVDTLVSYRVNDPKSFQTQNRQQLQMTVLLGLILGTCGGVAVGGAAAAIVHVRRWSKTRDILS